jgi:spore germination protein YaaH
MLRHGLHMKSALLKTLLLACVMRVTAASNSKSVLSWMCLERCHENITSDLEGILKRQPTLSVVSPEGYNVDESGGLVWNNFTDVTPLLHAGGVDDVYPMITSVSIENLRLLFADPDNLIHAAVADAVQHNYAGYNVDFECTGGTLEDAAGYTGFVDLFAKALHVVGKRLSVCVWRSFSPSRTVY